MLWLEMFVFLLLTDEKQQQERRRRHRHGSRQSLAREAEATTAAMIRVLHLRRVAWPCPALPSLLLWLSQGCASVYIYTQR